MAAFFLACNNPETAHKKQILSMRNEVLAIHDTAMLQMDALLYHKKWAQERMEVLDVHVNEDSIAIYSAFAIKAQAAYEGMMVWMRQYKEPNDEIAFDDAVIFYKAQHQSATEMSKAIFDVLNESKMFIHE